MVEIKKFYQASEPNRALKVENPEDHKYYIDFSSVRGGEIISEMKDHITIFSDDRSCALFTGHIGCGKSTELFRLKKDLEESGFHVVYFESSENLELTDVDIIDVMLAIAQQVTHSLAQLKVEEPKTFNRLLRGVAKVLQTEIELSAEGEIPGVGKVMASTEGKVSAEVNVPLVGKINASNQEGFSLVASGIGKITAKAKNDSGLRAKLSEYLGPKKIDLLKAINEELLEPAIAKLKQQGKKGLVVIVDNLDRLDNRPKPFGTPQQEYLFVDQGEYLNKLGCHVVYTMPLALKFSNEYGNLMQRFDDDPKVLPMVRVKLQDGTDCQQGINLLRQMVLARAFPDLTENQRLEKIPEIFDTPDSLDRLCRVSGGHVRDLLRLLNTWIKKGRNFPLLRATLEAVIHERRNEMAMPISDDEWELLRQVKQRKKVSGDDGYQILIRSRLVFEYRADGELWFDVNPILAEAQELQP